MFNNFFSTPQRDLDGDTFKHKFENSENAVLIDVRTGMEYSNGTIAGAENINMLGSDFQNQVQKLDEGNIYFLFCRSGNRSASAATVFEKSGLKVYSLAGGFNAWPKS